MEPRAEDTDLDQRNGRDRVRGRDRRVDAQPLELSPLCARLHPSIVSKWTDSRVRRLTRLRHLLPRHRGRRALESWCSRGPSIEYPSPRCAGEKALRGGSARDAPQSARGRSIHGARGPLNRAPFAPALAGEKVPKADEGVFALALNALPRRLQPHRGEIGLAD